MSKNINSKATLVQFNISIWTGRKYDRKALEAIEQKYNNASDSCSATKQLLGGKNPELEAIKQIACKARQCHYEMTLPWDKGRSLLPNKLHDRYCEKMREFEREFITHVNIFLGEYPRFVNEARFLLNGLYNPLDYPDQWDLVKKFNMSFAVEPLPTFGDFRLDDLSQDRVNEHSQALETRINEKFKAAQRDVYQRLLDVTKNLFERTKDPKAIFRDTLIGNVRDLVSIMEGLNLQDDSKLHELTKQLETITDGIEAQDLRNDSKLRNETSKQAEKILYDIENEMAQFSM